MAGDPARRDTLLDLLAEARRTALPPLERTTIDLDGMIESETMACRPSSLPEPTSLRVARRKVDNGTQLQRSLQLKVDALAQRLADHPPRSLLQRLFGPSKDPVSIALEGQLAKVRLKFEKATADLATARQLLKTEARKFEVAKARHQSTQTDREAQARTRIETANAARRLLTKNPRIALWGSGHLMRVATEIMKVRLAMDRSPEDGSGLNWDLVPILDLWGVPYLPPPR